MKITTSVLVGNLSGAAGDVVAASWKGRLYGRRRVTPANPNTDPQKSVRAAFTACVHCFQGLVSGIKTFLDKLGTDQQKAGFNVYVGSNAVQERGSYFHKVMPANRYCDPVAGMAAAAGASGIITVTWTPGTWTADDRPVILHRKIDGAGPAFTTPWVSFAVGAVTMVAGTISVTGLTPGATYAVALFPHDQSAAAYGGGDVKSAAAGA